jgi:hypothetical protein
VLARAARGRLVSLLAKDHVLGCEPSKLYQKLAGGRALKTPIEQTPFATLAPLGHAWRRSDFPLAAVSFSAFLALSAFLGGQVESVVFHHSLHGGLGFCPVGRFA